eukprot:CAMPEP_0113695184 /NCGR_PEP_ID=MMETSP0038_2-20120614/20749_1 /TAXON_ID=2898 /ORGANISM="Cryptomonas paramecium" /LENGTH=301 /DNA_ID=CAMNT_0000617679 /DNA_START=280 /DNA_END=1182 /DNA_ORIENTATION=- /assembly_acc=CAM_ASM_000170
MSKEVKRVNMNGSSDPYYRYTMPVINVKVEGTTKMIKSVLVNVEDVCQAIGRPVDYLVTFLGQELSANAKVDMDKDKEKIEKAYVTGAMDQKQVQASIFKFIEHFVQCEHCKNPETSVNIEGAKKNKILYLTCKSCGRRSDLDSEDRFVKYMISHPPSDANFGHAKTAAGAVGAVMAEVTAADEAKKKEKKEKKEKGDGEEKEKKKKKKDKEKGSDSAEEEGKDEKEEKKKKKKEKEKKKKEESEDSWDDDWGDDTSAEAVAKRQAALGGAKPGAEDIADKMAALHAKADKAAEREAAKPA